MGKYTERFIAWRNNSSEFLCDIFHEVDAEIAQLQRDHSALIERVKAHNADIHEAMADPDRWHGASQYLISLDAAEEGR